MTEAREIVVDAAEEGQRLDAVIARSLSCSHGEARRLVDEGRATCNGRLGRKGDRVRAGDRVVVRTSSWVVPARRDDVEVVFASDEVVVVDKPAGVPSHPLRPGEGGTALDAVCALFPEVATASDDPREGGLVHRLDTDTQGLLAFARTAAAREGLRAAFARGLVARGYLALVEGSVDAEVSCERPIAHDPRDARRMVVVEGAARARGAPREARTRAVPILSGEDASLVAVDAHGGRRHQVRVHLAAAGHPLAGDALYGGRPAPPLPGHALVAAVLGLPSSAPLVRAPSASFLAAAALRGAPVPDVDAALERLVRLVFGDRP